MPFACQSRGRCRGCPSPYRQNHPAPDSFAMLGGFCTAIAVNRLTCRVGASSLAGHRSSFAMRDASECQFIGIGALDSTLARPPSLASIERVIWVMTLSGVRCHCIQQNAGTRPSWRDALTTIPKALGPLGGWVVELAFCVDAQPAAGCREQKRPARHRLALHPRALESSVVLTPARKQQPLPEH